MDKCPNCEGEKHKQAEFCRECYRKLNRNGLSSYKVAKSIASIDTEDTESLFYGKNAEEVFNELV